MKPPILPILNAIGCLILTALVVILWNHERSLNRALELANVRVTKTQTLFDTETQRATALERDISVLKESIQATQESAEKTSGLLDQKESQNQTLQSEISAAREQVTVWQSSLTERDTKLRELSGELTSTRSRLDSAVAKLKAGAAP